MPKVAIEDSFEEAVLFCNRAKLTVNNKDYLTVIPYLPKNVLLVNC